MKILIAYASRHGSTKSCVERLAQALNNADVTCVNLEEAQVDPTAFDTVVFGSSLRFGKLLPSANAFLKTYRDILMQKTLALFLSCGYAHEYEYYLEKLFPAQLRDASISTLYFGGSLRKDGLSFLEKIVVRSMRSSIFENDIDNGEYTPTLPSILPENVDKMATVIREKLKNAKKI